MAAVGVQKARDELLCSLDLFKASLVYGVSINKPEKYIAEDIAIREFCFLLQATRMGAKNANLVKRF
jgi:hypothetical protein